MEETTTIDNLGGDQGGTGQLNGSEHMGTILDSAADRVGQG